MIYLRIFPGKCALRRILINHSRWETSRDSRVSKDSLLPESHREKIRKALWDKFSQSPELFLKDEIKNIRS